MCEKQLASLSWIYEFWLYALQCCAHSHSSALSLSFSITFNRSLCQLLWVRKLYHISIYIALPDPSCHMDTKIISDKVKLAFAHSLIDCKITDEENLFLYCCYCYFSFFNLFWNAMQFISFQLFVFKTKIESGKFIHTNRKCIQESYLCHNKTMEQKQMKKHTHAHTVHSID